MKKNYRKAIICVFVVLIICVLFFMFTNKKKELNETATPYSNLTAVNRKGDACNAFNANTSNEEMIRKLARTLDITYNGEKLLTDAGIVDGNTFMQDLLSITFSLDNGDVVASVYYKGESVAVNMCYTVDEAASGDATTNKKGNVVDLPAYALPEDQRNIMDASKGYKEAVYDENGNQIGTVAREDISGTVESDRKMEQTDGVNMVESSEGDRIHTEASAKPEEPTVEVDEPVIPEVPEVKPEETSKPDQPVVEQPPVETPVIPEDTPEYSDETVTEDIENNAQDQQLTLSSEYGTVVQLDAEFNVLATFFGSGSATLEITADTPIEDLGNGFVRINGMVFSR